MTYVAFIMWQIMVAGWQAPLEASVVIQNFRDRESCDTFAYEYVRALIVGADDDYHVQFTEHRCLLASEFERLIGVPS